MSVNKGGRPTKYDEQVGQVICTAVRAGNTRAASAAYAGVSQSTLRTWLIRGKDGDEPFASFYKQFRQAEADCIMRNIAIIQKAAEKTWQAAAWWLERKLPDQWGRDTRRLYELERTIRSLEQKIVLSQSDATFA